MASDGARAIQRGEAPPDGSEAETVRRAAGLAAAVIDDAKDEARAVDARAQRDAAAIGAIGDAVAHGVLDERLKNQRRNRHRKRGRVRRGVNPQPVSEPQLLERQVVLREAPLLCEQHLVFRAERIPEQIAEALERLVGAHGIAAAPERPRSAER